LNFELGFHFFNLNKKVHGIVTIQESEIIFLKTLFKWEKKYKKEETFRVIIIERRNNWSCVL